MESVCLACKKSFDARPADLKRGHAKFCCQSCATGYNNTIRKRPPKRGRKKKLKYSVYLAVAPERRVFQQLVVTARRRAAKRKLEHSIEWEDLQAKWTACSGKCPYTGTDMILIGKAGRTSPWKVTVDRIDPTKGYTVENTNLVCYWANIAKSDLSMEQFKTMCQAVGEIEKASVALVELPTPNGPVRS